MQRLIQLKICFSGIAGTSTLMIWLGSHSEIQCPQEENYNLMNDKPGQLVRDMYAQAPYENFLRGFKNPMEIFYPESSLKYIDQYFPKTKLIITLRHPVQYVSCPSETSPRADRSKLTHDCCFASSTTKVRVPVQLPNSKPQPGKLEQVAHSHTLGKSWSMRRLCW